MRSWIYGGALLVIAALFAACGSVQSTTSIRKAQEQVDAEPFDAASSYSVYEATLAEVYLKQARKDWAHSDWQHAEEYAEKAIHWSERAVERAEKHGPPTGVSDAPSTGVSK